MAYQYTLFDNVPLPFYNYRQDHDAMPVSTALLDSIGGSIDWRGTSAAMPRKQTITLQGVYFGETTYWVDDAGNRLVDDAGNYLIFGTGPTMLRGQIMALRDKQGVRGTLWRKRLDDDVLEWKTARLMSISWPSRWSDHALVAEVRCEFETAMANWHAASATTAARPVTNGTTDLLLIMNSGAPVYDAVLTVAVMSGTVTQIDVTNSSERIDFTWTGSLAAGVTLEMDTGDTQTIRTGATDQYSGFTLNAGHHAAGWLPLPTGDSALMMTITGGDATVSVKYYTQFP